MYKAGGEGGEQKGLLCLLTALSTSAGGEGKEEKGLRLGVWGVRMLTSLSPKSADAAVECVESRSVSCSVLKPECLCSSWFCSSDGVTWAPLRRNSANLCVIRDGNQQSL